MAETVAGAIIMIIIIAGGVLGAAAYDWLCDYCELKKMVEEDDDFEKLMRKQLELDAERLRAYEDMLREACQSQVEEEYGDEYEED